MITIFNRKEVMSTFDIGKQAAARELLAANNIDYTIKVISRSSSSRYSVGHGAYMGAFGRNVNYDTEFTIFVKKDDYEKAAYLLSKNRIY